MGAQFSDYEFGFRYGEREAMDRTSYKDCNFNIATDTGSLSIDIEGKRIELTDIITGYSEVEIRAIAIPSTKVYLANDTFNLLVFDFAGGKWRIASSEVTLHAQKAEQDGNGNTIVSTYETKLDAQSTETTLRGLITNLQYQINTINRFNIVFVDADQGLPDEGESFVIYFVPIEDQSSHDGNPNTENRYAEYIWIGGKYEQIGLISVDLANYYTKSETYSKDEIDDSFYDLSYVSNITQSGNVFTVESSRNGTNNFNLGVMGINIGSGLVSNAGQTISNTGNISLNLKNSTASLYESAARTNTENREYPVGIDAEGYLSVNVPWTNSDHDTHYDSSTVVSNSPSGLSNIAAGNEELYLNHIENNTVVSSHNIVGTGSATVFSDNNGKITINSIKYESREAASGGIDLSLVTTGEKYTWNNKCNLGETSTTAYRGDRGKIAYDHSQVRSGNPHNVNKNEIGLGNVGNFKAVSTVASQGLSSTEQANARANIDAATSGHTHTTSIAASSGTNQLTLAASTKYAITAGGTSYVFTTPPNTTYTANNGVGLSGTTFYNSGVRSVATGSSNGTISVNTNGTAADVAVKGLGSAAYETVAETATGSTVVKRNSSGYIYATYYNQSSNAETPTTSSYLMYCNSDGWLRKSSLANIKSILGLGSAAYTASTAYAAASHTHNYAGSSSAGGAATSLANFENNNSSGKDANNVTYNAHTYYSSNGPATSIGASTNDGALYSQAYSATWVAQIAQDYRNGNIFVRGKNNGTWQSWKKPDAGTINGVKIEKSGNSYGYYNGSTFVAFKSQADINAAVAAAKVGTATAAQVLTGYTFTNSTTSGISGTMVNQGTKTYTINPGGSQTIPAGYHNGSGKVTANPNQNSATYTPTTRAANIDMGATNSYRYVTTTSVPNNNTQTYTFTTSDPITKDLTATHNYRYVNTQKIFDRGYDMRTSAIVGNAAANELVAGKTATIAGGTVITGTATNWSNVDQLAVLNNGDDRTHSTYIWVVEDRGAGNRWYVHLVPAPGWYNGWDWNHSIFIDVQEIFNDGYNQGYNAGYNQGYNQGKSESSDVVHNFRVSWAYRGDTDGVCYGIDAWIDDNHILDWDPGQNGHWLRQNSVSLWA